jgi:NDP-sugar pyrophosphorylase family protein
VHLRLFSRGPSGAGWVDYGLLAFERSALEAEGPDELADVRHDLAADSQLAGYPASERFYEIGSPEALAETEAFLSGRPADGVCSDAESSIDDL